MGMEIKNEKLVQSNWEDLGSLDPMWAVLSDPQKRYGNWKECEFYETGNTFIEDILKKGNEFKAPENRTSALDFGCGLGRLTFALSKSFSKVVGVDVSLTMLEKAKLYGQKSQNENCFFVHNNEENLKEFANNSCDFVCTYIVLQHIPDKVVIESYIREFVRILKPGGLLFFQIPTFVPILNRLQLKRRVYDLLRRSGVPKKILYSALGLHPIHYNYVLPSRIRIALEGAKILKIDDSVCTPTRVVSSNYFVTKE